MASLSIKQLKAALDELNVNYSACNEKRELIELYEQHAKTTSTQPAASTDSSSQPGPADADLETTLAKLNNLNVANSAQYYC